MPAKPLQQPTSAFSWSHTTVSGADLKAYYAATPWPPPFLDYLKAAADGTNPFVYIKGSTVTLVDAAKHDLQGRADVDMTVPDDSRSAPTPSRASSRTWPAMRPR